MLPFNALSPEEMALAVSGRARALRLHHDLTQQGLADRAGVSLGSLKRFERTGAIAFTSLIRIAQVLDALDELEALFPEPEFRSIDDAIAREKRRQRGRRS